MGWTRALPVLAMALCSAPLLAHDLWIEPSSFAPKVGEVVGVRLRVGEHLAGEPLPLIPALVERFSVDDAQGSRPVASRRGGDPAGAIGVIADGMQVVAYHSRASRVELPAATFNKYLAEEGLEAVAALRAQRGESDAPARELFSRCAKSLLAVGVAREEQGDRALGCRLELVAERNPYALGEGDELPLRLSYEGKPLPGALVVALNSADPADKQAARSDAQGRVTFRLRAGGGMWLVKAVHTVPAPAGVDADWTSWWASVTFAGRAGDAQ